jgi:hypothetical protein
MLANPHGIVFGIMADIRAVLSPYCNNTNNRNPLLPSLPQLILFSPGLFKDVFPVMRLYSFGYYADRQMMLEKFSEGSGRGLIEIISCHLSGRIQETHNKRSQLSRCPSLDSKLGPSEYI